MNQWAMYCCINLVLPLVISAASYERITEGSVAFASVGRAHYAFDIYALNLGLKNPQENILTDEISVNYNGHFLDPSARKALLQKEGMQEDQADEILVFVTERNGMAQIYFNLYSKNEQSKLSLLCTKSMKFTVNINNINRREALGTKFQAWVPLNFVKDDIMDSSVSMEDRPSMVGSRIIYVSTRQSSGVPGQSWAAVYSTDIRTGETQRLTPEGISDLSPSVSPSGEWTMVASYGQTGWHGQIQDLHTNLYLFNTSDGSNRRLVIRNGGWPSWADDGTVYFHRKSDDGWWSIYKASFSGSFKELSPGSVTVERITPPGLHAFTPAASVSGKWVAVATRRPDNKYRHIEIFNLGLKSFIGITNSISPWSHHYNPFVSYNSETVGYHKCRGVSAGDFGQEMDSFRVPLLENVKSPLPGISMFRIDGEFPAFSPDGSLIAYISKEGDAVYVMKLDGSGKRKIFSGAVFGLAWDWKRNDLIYTSHGPDFATLNKRVDIIALDANNIVSEEESGQNHSCKQLTNEGNNAFPSPSPDGRFVVFRSGRSGYKNLYIMDSEKGEDAGLWRLTEGPWTDTMCTWSPDGKWIAFSSDRENPGSDSFALYLVHPNGTGLQKILTSGTSGRVNHPWFSPDSKSLIFTSDYAGISAEPISVPHQFGPFGEIFMADIDGCDVQRLTHNAYEDGTPSWGKRFISASDLRGQGENLRCDFEDDRLVNGSVGILRQSRCLEY